jgi:hypothetical protein
MDSEDRFMAEQPLPTSRADHPLYDQELDG